MNQPHAAPSHYTNGSHTSYSSPITNAQAGPSNLLQLQSRHMASAEFHEESQDNSDVAMSISRSEAASPDAATPHSNSKPGKQRDGPKKKKATRACNHCQKAHLTCDDSRPCQRCIKRGITDCVEGHRKKPKYIWDDDDLDQQKPQQEGQGPNDGSADHNMQTMNNSFNSTSITNPQNSYAANMEYGFGSEGANHEYLMIENLLGNTSAGYPPTPQDGAMQNGLPPLISHPSWQQSPRPPTERDVPNYPPTSESSTSTPTQFYQSPPLQQPNFLPGMNQPTLSSPGNNHNHQLHSQPLASSGQRQYPQPASASFDPAPLPPTPQYVPPVQQQLIAPKQHENTVNYGMQPFGGPSQDPTMDLDIPADVYARVTAPYDYTAGYHFLMKYLQTSGFDKNDILRVVRALAIFRPSLIALQMPLSVEDEIFVEKCFQRSLLELDKLIIMSGTPTVVWRRTGEICLVGLEFSLLTEWPRHELLGGKKFIYQLFEPQSTVEYWENFANHAFENTTQSVHSHCVLVKPSGKHIPCTFCFSIRRDLFDLPYVVIGQWLPML